MSAVPTRGCVIVWAGLLIALSMALLPASAAAAGTPAAPEFSLTIQDLRAMTAALPKTVRDRIIGEPRVFLHLLSQVLDEPAEYLLLVDKKHLLSLGDVPADLVSLSAYPLSVSRARPLAAQGDHAGRARHGRRRPRRRRDPSLLIVVPLVRVPEEVYEREVKMYGQQAADRESARPGTSQHQLGTAVDFGSITDAFAETKAGRWLSAHAEEYGFSLSFPKGYEERHGLPIRKLALPLHHADRGKTPEGVLRRHPAVPAGVSPR